MPSLPAHPTARVLGIALLVVLSCRPSRAARAAVSDDPADPRDSASILRLGAGPAIATSPEGPFGLVAGHAELVGQTGCAPGLRVAFATGRGTVGRAMTLATVSVVMTRPGAVRPVASLGLGATFFAYDARPAAGGVHMSVALGVEASPVRRAPALSTGARAEVLVGSGTRDRSFPSLLPIAEVYVGLAF